LLDRIGYRAMLRESRVENMEQKQKITVSVVPIPPLGTIA
jgi:hypothetical protein